LKSTENLDVYEGHGRFAGTHTVLVGDERLEAAKIFINVGARPFVPPIDGLEKTDFLTSSSMMAVESLPPHLVIIGGSYIGLEFAQMFRRFGSEVSLVEKGPRLLAREDDDISGAIKEILEDEGVEVHLKAECIGAGREGEQVMVRLGGEAGDTVLRGSHLLLAVGRSPNTHDLGLAEAGIETDGRGYIVVDDQLRTNVPGIWALGDCNGRGAFTHTSYNDYEIVAANLLHDDPRRVSDRTPAYALYIDPPLGRAGASESEVRRSGRKALIAKRPMTRVARAVEKGETQGLMKIVVDAETKEVLGAAILGIGGDEIIHSILDVMVAKAPYTVVQRAMHIHPTVSELIPTMLGDLEPLQ
jgi:pyruvate/2-oxoglutarate dehydrogenase complex dihydrolipoamide dehydrogenase (E3) component